MNISLNRLQDAETALDGLQKNGFDPEPGWSSSYKIAFLRNDTAEMKRQAAVGMSRPRSKGDALMLEARTEAYHGHLKKARELGRLAVGFQSENGFREVAARNLAVIALEDAECGHREAAKQGVTSVLSRSPGRTAQPLAALAFVEIGELAQAKTLITELERAYPLDTILNRYWLPTVRAAIQIKQRSPNDAVSTLEATVDYELAIAGPLYPAYMRGRAYLLQQNTTAAAAEFQKLLDHSGIVLNDPLGALGRLQLARAYALQGDKTKALNAYEDFLILWKDADPDIPIYQQAKAEYAKLQ